MGAFLFLECDTLDDRLVNALVRVRQRAGGPGARAYLAAVGNWLRDEGIDVSHLRPLSSFVQSLNGFCRLSGDYVVFDDGAVQGSAPAAPNVPSPSPSRPDISIITGVNGPASGAETFVLHSDLWRAMVNDHAQKLYHLDLSTLLILESPRDTLDEGIKKEPERYIAIPTMSTEDQRSFVVDLLRSKGASELAEALAPPATVQWMRTLRELASPELQATVTTARREWIIDKAREWMRAHGLPEARFVSVNRRRRERTDDEHRHPSSSNESDRLRAALHRAIDRMTPGELSSLRIPARLLID